jgi:Flp pilus assembly protein TadG
MRLQRIKRKIAGIAMIEFLLTVPILAILLIGVMEFGVLFYDQSIIDTASREGARYGIVQRSGSYATSAQITTYAKTFCNSNLITFAGSNPAVTVTVTPGTVASGNNLVVTVSYVYTGFALYQYLSITQAKTLTSSTTMNYQ